MARNFVAASSQYAEVDIPPVTAAPLTISCWVTPASTGITQTLVWLGDKDVTNHQYRLFIESATNRVRFTATGGGAAANADTSVGVAAGTNYHACGVAVSNSSRIAYLNGGNSGTNSTSVTPAGLDRISIGRRGSSSPDTYAAGDISEVAIWNAALSDANVALLAKGTSPTLIVPQSLVFYAPLLGRYSPEIDVRGGLNLTLTNTPTASAHPRIFYRPTPSGIFVPAAGGGGGDAVPQVWAQYRRRRAG